MAHCPALINRSRSGAKTCDEAACRMDSLMSTSSCWVATTRGLADDALLEGAIVEQGSSRPLDVRDSVSIGLPSRCLKLAWRLRSDSQNGTYRIGGAGAPARARRQGGHPCGAVMRRSPLYDTECLKGLASCVYNVVDIRSAPPRTA
jgi:hypothetical protein